MEPAFLDLSEIVEIHHDQIERYGGKPGIRDVAALESALAMPRAGSRDRYFHADLFEMAAAYLYHMVKNHPFVDGNKCTGAMAAFMFLRFNGFSLKAPNEELERMVVATAAGKVDKAALTQFLRKHSRRGSGRG